MPEAWIPIVTGSIFIIVTGAVILLRPVSKQLGEFLEVMIQEKRGELRGEESRETRKLLERLDQRLDHMEERLDFTERLLTSDRDEQPPGERAGSGG